VLSNYFADPWEENNNCNWCKQLMKKHNVYSLVNVMKIINDWTNMAMKAFSIIFLIVKSFKWVIASYSVPNYMSQVYFLKIASDLNGQANVICFATI